jgi:hypothetical protein
MSGVPVAVPVALSTPVHRWPAEAALRRESPMTLLVRSWS